MKKNENIRWVVEKHFGTFLFCKEPDHWDIIDLVTGKRESTDHFHSQEQAQRQADIYNEQGGPTE